MKCLLFLLLSALALTGCISLGYETTTVHKDHNVEVALKRFSTLRAAPPKREWAVDEATIGNVLDSIYYRRKGWVILASRKSTRLFSDREAVLLRLPLTEALGAAAPGDRVLFSVYSGDFNELDTRGEFFFDEKGLNLRVSQIREPRPGLGDENPSYEFDHVTLEAKRNQFLRNAKSGKKRQHDWLVITSPIGLELREELHAIRVTPLPNDHWIYRQTLLTEARNDEVLTKQEYQQKLKELQKGHSRYVRKLEILERLHREKQISGHEYLRRMQQLNATQL